MALRMVLLPIHVTAGLIAISAGAVALYAAKGSPLHRRSGMVFVVAMLVMASCGAILAGIKLDRGTALGGVLVFYIVCTAVLTVKRRVEESRGLLTALMLMGLAIVLAEYGLGLAALASPDHKFDGYKPSLYFTFGSIALLAVLGDARTLWRGTLTGVKRMTRHIWRMCYAMWIATASLFLGQPKVFPEPLRHAMGIRAIPVVLVLVLMIYWLIRVRIRRKSTAPRAHTPAQAAT